MTIMPADAGSASVSRIPAWCSAEEAIAALEAIPEGRDDASKYHAFILQALRYVFEPHHLADLEKEVEINEGRKRIDIVADNTTGSGFFHMIRNNTDIRCLCIPFECKNYFEQPANPEIDQLLGRFDTTRGMLGVLVCRTVSNSQLLNQRCIDAYNSLRAIVLWLADNDMKQMLRLRAADDLGGIGDFLYRTKFKPIVLRRPGR